MSFIDNTKQVNHIISRTLGWCFFSIIALMLSTWFGIFHFNSDLKAIIMIVGTATTLVPAILEHFKVDDVFLKYYMLTTLSIFIGLMGANNGVGIYITYAIVPIASCLYFDSRFIKYMGIISYLTMTFGVYINTANKLEVRFLNWSHMITFRNYMIGFTIEYLAVMLFLYQIVSRAQRFMEIQQENLKVLQDEKVRREKVSELYKETLSVQRKTSYDLITKASKTFTPEDYTRLAAGHQYIAQLQGILNYSDNMNEAFDRVFQSLGEYFKLDRVLYIEPDFIEGRNRLTFQWARHDKDILYDFYNEMTEADVAAISLTYDRLGYIEYGKNYADQPDFIDCGLTRYTLSKIMGRNLWLPTVAEGSYIGAVCFDKKDSMPYSTVDICLLAEAVNIISLHIVRFRADNANRAKSTFLSTMSHEIRTPMNAILGMTIVSLREEMSDSLRSNLNIIKSSAEGLLGIINDILDFSKIENGKVDLIHEDYQLKVLINDLKTIVDARNLDKGLEINYNIDPNLPSVLYGDMVRIKQVMVNLCTNAIKYTQEGSVSINISSSKIDKDACMLHFSVVDTGQGIKDEDRPYLFRSFSQVSQEMNHHTEGTGLGLAISKQLIDLMNGNIDVISTFGEGSTFYFNIPQIIKNETVIDFEEPVISESEDEDLFTTKNCKVLLVDDNLINIMVAQEIMAPFEMEIETATGGQECVDLTIKKKYDLIFMDHFMPEMDGEQATRIIRENAANPNRTTPIIALTADAVVGAKEQLLNAGMDDFLSKPIDMNAVKHILKKFLPEEKIVE